MVLLLSKLLNVYLKFLLFYLYFQKHVDIFSSRDVTPIYVTVYILGVYYCIIIIPTERN